MKEITIARLSALDTTIKKKFDEGIALTDPSFLNLFTERISSNKSAEQYTAGDRVPTTKEIDGEYTFEKLSGKYIIVKNKKYGNGIEILKEHLEDDTINQFFSLAAGLGAEGTEHKTKLMFDFINAGTTLDLGTTYDEVPFFSDAHENKNSGIQSNIGTGTGTSIADLKNDYRATKTLLQQLKDSQGEPMAKSSLIKWTILCSPALEFTFRDLLNSTIINNSTNTDAGSADLKVSPYLTGNDWYLTAPSPIAKPLILQDRVPLSITTTFGIENSFEVLNKDIFQWKVRSRYNIGYNKWQTIFKVDNT